MMLLSGQLDAAKNIPTRTRVEAAKRARRFARHRQHAEQRDHEQAWQVTFEQPQLPSAARPGQHHQAQWPSPTLCFAPGGEHVTYERLRAMGTNGFQEPAAGFEEGKIVGSTRLYTEGVFSADDGRARFMDAPWRGLQASGKEQQKAAYAFLINNGRTNHVWQSAYLDVQNDS